jgi:hypothetical protein
LTLCYTVNTVDDFLTRWLGANIKLRQVVHFNLGKLQAGQGNDSSSHQRRFGPLMYPRA